MRRVRVLAILLLGFMLGGIAVAEEADPVVVRVGDFSYTRSLAEFAMSASLDVAEAFGGEISAEDRLAIRDSTLERLLGIGVIENKLSAYGRNEFTEDEKELLMADARSRYESTWQALYQELKQQDDTVTEADVTEWMNDEGYTVEAFYREALVSERQFRAIDMFCGDVTVTAAEVEQFYQENYVEPEREKYENDIAAWEADVLIGGDETFYTPEGYRYVKQILLDYPEEMKAALKPYERKAAAALSKARSAYIALADAAAEAGEWDAIVPYKEAYSAAMEDYQAANRARRDKQEDALQMLKATTDEIAERYAAGIRFESLMEAYSADRSHVAADDPGVPFHPDSPNWDERFKATAAALESPGDISKPVATEQGVCVIRYMGDMPGGVHALTDEERTALEQAALYSAQMKALQALVATWQNDYEIEIHPELIDVE